jgi:hypothetical protein
MLYLYIQISSCSDCLVQIHKLTQLMSDLFRIRNAEKVARCWLCSGWQWSRVIIWQEYVNESP